MAAHNINPVREQLRGEILTALACGEPMTTAALYARCPSAVDAEDVSRLAWELKRKGMIADGGKVPHPRGTPVNSYILADPYLAAAKPIQVEPVIKKSRQPAKKRKPAPGNPFTASIRPQEAHDGLPRVTRDLPQHLQSSAPHDAFPTVSPIAQTTTAPQLAAEGINHYIEDHIMSEDPIHYADPEPFALEPRDPEAEEDVDSDLVSALMALAHHVEADTADDLLGLAEMASTDVGEIAAAMSKRHESAPKKVCKCIRLNSLPPLPAGYRFSSIVASIFSEHDGETMDVHVVDEGDGPFVKIYTTGGLSFGLGEMALISEAADALIKLLESDHE